MTKKQSYIKYIEPEDLNNIVNIIRSFNYENEKEIPDYDKETDAIDKYFALIDRSKTEYYPDIFDKASHLFININSHYFSNGNKRLSVVSTVIFLEKNGFIAANLSKENYREIIKNLFGNFSLAELEGFEPKDFGIYNLAIIVAMQNEKKQLKVSNDDLKKKVKIFFKKTFIDK